MTYDDALSFIHGIPRLGKKPGLTRIKKLLDKMGNPQDKLKFVHVAGTNGKGSTSTMTSFILKEAGYKTGLYISPFIIDFRERIQVNNAMISQQELCTITEYVHNFWCEMNENGEPPSEFEVVVSIALEYFYRQKCDIVVLEVGMGGRFDSTNVINTPLVSVITSIGMDHTHYLGDTIDKIAMEKCGIIKPDGITIAAAGQDPKALAVIMEHCAGKNNVLIQPVNGEIKAISEHGSDIEYRGMNIHIPLMGKHQVLNALTVIECALALRSLGFAISDENIKDGIAKTKFPSRMEIFGSSPKIVLDGAHNEPAARVLAESLPLIEAENIYAILSVSQDKDANMLFSYILPLCKEVILTNAKSNFKSSPPQSLMRLAKKYSSQITIEEDSELAFIKGLNLCGKNDVLLISGSLYLTSELRPLAIGHSKLMGV